MSFTGNAVTPNDSALCAGDGESSWRKALPASMSCRSNVSIWSVLKRFIGRDLTRISIPVVFNEPLSLLQRLAEYMEYAELLKKASECTDCIERFEYVVAFVVSSLSCNYMRLSKPFNPLWFETYELDRTEESGYRFVAEQVSHHPPISAFHADSDSYVFDGVVSPRLKFWGTSVEVQPSGKFTLKLLRHNEIYTWNTLSVKVHNIVMGQMYIQLEGELSIRCNAGLECKMSFKNDDSGPSKESTFFHGYISKCGKAFKAAYGNWTTFFATCSSSGFDRHYDDWLEIGKQAFRNDASQESIPLVQGSKIIWKSRPRPSNSSVMYNFTSFTFLLNDPCTITHKIPATDSRRRPDVRLLEAGLIGAAEKEKERLEVKQREARALMKRTQEKLPKWFLKRCTKSKDELSWSFTGRYWNREFEDCEDIY